jgi:type I restriction enzyme, S subunit
MSTYSTYKTSGIEWLGDIPHNWEVNRLKNMLRRKVTDGPHETPEFTDDGIPFLSVDGIQEGQLVFEDCRFISKSDHLKYQQKVIVEKGDVLMGKAASTGKIAQVKTDLEFNVWSPLAIIKPTLNRLIPTYLEYCLKSYPGQIQIDLLCTSNTQKNISMDDIPKIILPEPSYNEQTAIANYLDEKTSKLDQLISNKKAQIEKLKEIRQIEINTAVTKGLDPNVKLKPSGKEWLGDIPEHWGLKTLKKFGRLLGGYAFKSEVFLEEGPVKVLKITNIQTMSIIWEDIEYVEDIYYNAFNDYSVRNGDLVFALTRPIISTGIKAAIANILKDEKILINQRTAVFKPSRLLLPSYLYYVVLSDSFFQDFRLKIKTTNQPNISTEDIGRIKIAVPPEEEQRVIANYLDEKTSKLDKLVNNLENQIERLEEVRKIEIYNAVTGKIKTD